MKILKSIRRDKGFGLILALTFLVIMLVLMASTINWSTTESRDTQRSNQFVASQYAAEGAMENILGEVNYDFLFNSLSNSSAYIAMPTNISSWPIQYIFSNPTNLATNSIYVNIGAQTANLTPLPAPYTGLQAFYQQCDVAVTATPIGQRYNVPSTVHATILASQIPIYQYLIFYNVNLEINAAQTLDAKGPVFSNGGFWSGTANVTFEQTVWAVSNAYNQASDPFANYTGSGTANFNLPGQPVSGVSPLTIPVAGVNNTNNSPAIVHKILEWPVAAYGLGTADAYTTNGLTYLANAAGLIISNSVSGTNFWNGTTVHTNFIWVYYQDSTYQSSALNHNPNNLTNSIIWVTNDFYVLKLANTNVPKSPTNYVPPSQFTNILYAGYSFLTNLPVPDWREGWNGGSGPAKSNQVVQFSVTNFYNWLNNSAANGGSYYNTLSQNNWHHSIGGIYIYNNVAPTAISTPAVEVVKGAYLRDTYGLTIATQFPLYVQGDYNVMDGTGTSVGANSTVHARPAAFLSDAFSFLSNGWGNSNSKDPSSGSQTTLNAACLSGIVPSDKSINTSDDASYSGGVENFFRLLENWGGANFYYNGSIVVMFPSQYATNRWRQTGNYYGAPTRKWAFDTNFNVQVKLPPMTPNVKAFIRTDWSGN